MLLALLALLERLVRLTGPRVVLRRLVRLLNEIGRVKGQNVSVKGMVPDRSFLSCSLHSLIFLPYTILLKGLNFQSEN